jgi:hypothetical protein
MNLKERSNNLRKIKNFINLLVLKIKNERINESHIRDLALKLVADITNLIKFPRIKFE